MKLLKYSVLVILIKILCMSHSMAQKDTILIDMGSVVSPLPWNNITNVTNGQVANLINSQGHSTGVSISVNDAFNTINTTGTQNPDTTLGFPPSATGDSFFGNTVLFNNKIEPTGGFIINNLKPLKQYTLTICASRVASDNRETRYIVTGLSTDTLYINPSSSTAITITDSLYPAADSTIRIHVSPGPNNNNSSGFYYIGALRLIYDHEPLTGPAILTLESPNGGEFWQVGKTPSIIWKSSNIGTVHIEYSLNQGSSWQTIGTVPAYFKEHIWPVPATPSQTCLVRISADTLTDISDAVFEIANDTVDCRLVVLGSSTSAGAGASVPDSSWVNRYRKAIFQKNTRYSVINLGKGAYTTFHILPNGTPMPSGVNITIDTARNITKALSYNPSGIIINMPSNDAAYNFSVSQQLNNFSLLEAMAAWGDARLWVCTTQPRNFINPLQIQIQEDMRDSILLRYGNYALDFWTGAADTNGFISSTYDSGDGIHLNDAGHRLLFEIAMQKAIDTVNCAPVLVSLSEHLPNVSAFHVYPNPANYLIHIDVTGDLNSEAMLSVFNIQGQLVAESRLGERANVLNMSHLPEGLYIYSIRSGVVPMQRGKIVVAR